MQVQAAVLSVLCIQPDNAASAAAFGLYSRRASSSARRVFKFCSQIISCISSAPLVPVTACTAGLFFACLRFQSLLCPAAPAPSRPPSQLRLGCCAIVSPLPSQCYITLGVTVSCAILSAFASFGAPSGNPLYAALLGRGAARRHCSGLWRLAFVAVAPKAFQPPFRVAAGFPCLMGFSGCGRGAQCGGVCRFLHWLSHSGVVVLRTALGGGTHRQFLNFFRFFSLFLEKKCFFA